ncbi:uncharacterized protein RSE6_12997 [Rhynchosporium secalis]|uniref:Uncharacterized protein n=1 Tax=Rhynchosporium secalis TaxID=38038 RepID=A0A1E1MRU9_RHYSE|nr:uncharacterized protein RSE6_12997 [Rhynchosporium secalis]
MASVSQQLALGTLNSCLELGIFNGSFVNPSRPRPEGESWSTASICRILSKNGTLSGRMPNHVSAAKSPCISQFMDHYCCLSVLTGTGQFQVVQNGFEDPNSGVFVFRYNAKCRWVANNQSIGSRASRSYNTTYRSFP